MGDVMRRIVSAAFALTLFLPFAAFAQNFNYQTDVGYTRLKAEQGGATPTGSDQKATQVEASADSSNTQTYFPDPANSQFAGKTLTSHGPTPIVSGHATAVGQLF